MGPLEGIKVLDLTRYLSGPTLTMLLGDLGADISKVEPLPGGDPSRQSGPFHDGESVYYLASNRNKRSIAVDLRASEGRAILLRLIDRADILVENFKPGVAELLGISPEVALEQNPRLIYASITGFGSEGAGASLPGFDQTAQAMSGVMSVTGTEQTGPLRVGIAVADSTAGIVGAVGVLAALHQRDRTGRGSVVQTSLMQAMLSLMSYQAQKYLSLDEIPVPVGNDHPIMFPQGVFQTADGALTLASGNEKMWRRLCSVLGLEEWAEDPRYRDNAGRMRNRAQVRELIERALAERPATEWVPLINAAGVPCSTVLNVAEALDHPVTAELHMVEAVEHPLLGSLRVLGRAVTLPDDDDPWLRRHPPLLGEHSRDVLHELGYSSVEIDTLIESGIVGTRSVLT